MQSVLKQRIMLRAASVMILLGALSACNDQEKTASKVLATVNGEDITARQLEAELWSAAGGSGAGAARQPAVRKQALEALVDRQVLLDEALRNKIDRDPKVIQILDRLKTQAIVQAYLESKASNLANASKEEIDAYYKAHPELFAQRKAFDVTQLTVAAKDFTPAVKAMMDQARSLDQVARWLEQRGIAYVKAQRSYTSEELPAEMAVRLQRLRRNSLFVMQDKDGGQDELCMLTDLRNSPVTEEAATAQIERYLLNKKMQAFATSEIARLRASAKLVYVDSPPQLMVQEADGKTASAGVAQTR